MIGARTLGAGRLLHVIDGRRVSTDPRTTAPDGMAWYGLCGSHSRYLGGRPASRGACRRCERAFALEVDGIYDALAAADETPPLPYA